MVSCMVQTGVRHCSVAAPPSRSATWVLRWMVIFLFLHRPMQYLVLDLQQPPPMGTDVGRAIGCAGAMAMSIMAFGVPQLHLDGILIVKGLPLEGSQVIVITRDGEAQVLTRGLARFTLDLDLQKDYLVSFQRPGCVSKQLRFNTNVPVENLNPEGYRFPFQVTLEPAPEGQSMEYAGPVGYIQFDAKLNDFSYNTDYRILKDDFLTKELERAQAELNAKVQPVPSVGPGLAKDEGSMVPKHKLPMVEAVDPVMHDMVASVVSRTPPMVHVLGTSAITSRTPANRPDQTAADHPAPPSPPVPARPEAVATKASSEPLHPERAVAVEKEVQVDSLHVTTIIRFQKGASTDEYRRVVSYYGGTTYFKNGQACSEDTFQRSVAQ